MSAGKLGYQSFSPALDIVGAGQDGVIRLIKIWDDPTVGGNITADNTVSCASVSADSVYVGDLSAQNFLCTQTFNAPGDITVGNNIFCAGIHADHVVCNMDSSFPSIYVDRVGGGLVDVQRVRCDSADTGNLSATTGSEAIGDQQCDIEISTVCSADYYGADKISSYIYAGGFETGLNGIRVNGTCTLETPSQEHRMQVQMLGIKHSLQVPWTLWVQAQLQDPEM